jgi:solute carrier family 25 carnitine/acylcarnitine transporter 20/29
MEENEGLELKADISEFSHKANILSAFVSSMSTSFIFIPLDLIKIRMQQTDDKVGTFKMIARIYKEEGFKGFYKGSLFLFLCSGLLSSTRMYLYNFFQHHSDKAAILSNQSGRIFIQAATNAIITSVFMNPIEHVRIQTCLPEYRNQYSGSIHALRVILKEHGFRTLQRCLHYTLAREFIYFSSYFHVLEVTRNAFSRMEMAETGRILSNLLAGPISWVFIYPLDTIKTNLQADSLVRPRLTGYNYLQQLHAQGRLSSVYSGFSPVILRSSVSNLFFLTAWERSLAFILSLENKYGI